MQHNQTGYEPLMGDSVGLTPGSMAPDQVRAVRKTQAPLRAQDQADMQQQAEADMKQAEAERRQAEVERRQAEDLEDQRIKSLDDPLLKDNPNCNTHANVFMFLADASAAANELLMYYVFGGDVRSWVQWGLIGLTTVANTAILPYSSSPPPEGSDVKSSAMRGFLKFSLSASIGGVSYSLGVNPVRATTYATAAATATQMVENLDHAVRRSYRL